MSDTFIMVLGARLSTYTPFLPRDVEHLSKACRYCSEGISLVVSVAKTGRSHGQLIGPRLTPPCPRATLGFMSNAIMVVVTLSLPSSIWDIPLNSILSRKFPLTEDLGKEYENVKACARFTTQ